MGRGCMTGCLYMTSGGCECIEIVTLHHSMCVYVHVFIYAHVCGNMNGLLWGDYIFRKHMIWNEQMTNLSQSYSKHTNTVNVMRGKAK